MGDVPSIKGSVFIGLVESLGKLIDRGELTRQELAQMLDPADLAHLDKPIGVSKWYDIRSYDRINAVLLQVEGGGDPAYFREQGRLTAKRLMEAGLYGQLEYLHRTQFVKEKDPEARFAAFGRDIRLLTSLSSSILNFTEWTARPDPDQALRYRIEVTGAAQMPDSLCWRSEGFINGMSTIRREDDRWCWHREGDDLVMFRMIRSI